jgi:hypothetical protein
MRDAVGGQQLSVWRVGEDTNGIDARTSSTLGEFLGALHLEKRREELVDRQIECGFWEVEMEVDVECG